jgi:hypothetical protein
VIGKNWRIGVLEFWNKKRKAGMVEDWNIGKGAETDFVLSCHLMIMRLVLKEVNR